MGSFWNGTAFSHICTILKKRNSSWVIHVRGLFELMRRSHALESQSRGFLCFSHFHTIYLLSYLWLRGWFCSFWWGRAGSRPCIDMYPDLNHGGPQSTGEAAASQPRRTWLLLPNWPRHSNVVQPPLHFPERQSCNRIISVYCTTQFNYYGGISERDSIKLSTGHVPSPFFR